MPGADLVELGVPFSGPSADARRTRCRRDTSVGGGRRLDSVLDLGAAIGGSRAGWWRWRTPTCCLLAAAEFAARVAESGLVGYRRPPTARGGRRGSGAELNARGLALIPLDAPLHPPARRRSICADAQGFVYLVSDTRTQGERAELPEALESLIASTQADAAVAVGFGIGTSGAGRDRRQRRRRGDDRLPVRPARVAEAGDRPRRRSRSPISSRAGAGGPRRRRRQGRDSSADQPDDLERRPGSSW